MIRPPIKVYNGYQNRLLIAINIYRICLCELLSMLSINHDNAITTTDAEVALSEIIGQSAKKIKSNIQSLSFYRNFKKIFVHQRGRLRVKQRIILNTLDPVLVCDLLLKVDGFVAPTDQHCQSDHICCNTCVHRCKICNKPKCKNGSKCCELPGQNCNHECKGCGELYRNCSKSSNTFLICCQTCQLCDICGNNQCPVLRLRKVIHDIKTIRNCAYHLTEEEFQNNSFVISLHCDTISDWNSLSNFITKNLSVLLDYMSYAGNFGTHGNVLSKDTKDDRLDKMKWALKGLNEWLGVSNTLYWILRLIIFAIIISISFYLISMCWYTMLSEPTYACESQNLLLRCSQGKVLHISDANYGRYGAFSNRICPGQNWLSTSSCKSKNTLAIVQQKCNGKYFCLIHASNSVFGDPCVGIYKFLSVHRQCLKKKSTVACENTNLTLACSARKILRISYANFGPLSKKHCSGEKKVETTSCKSNSTIMRLRKLCNNTTSCTVNASTKVFGEPCSGTYKYLEVKYDCIMKLEGDKIFWNRTQTKKNFLRLIACEHDTLHLKFPTSLVLKISYANYGRLSKKVCHGQNSARTTSCIAKSSMSHVKDTCHNKTSCSIAASNKVFGDPCGGVFKYLKVEYTCV